MIIIISVNNYSNFTLWSYSRDHISAHKRELGWKSGSDVIRIYFTALKAFTQTNIDLQFKLKN